MTKVAILGAGIAGLSSAWMFEQAGFNDYLILEKQAYTGGLARSFNWHGFDCDFAAHRLFTTDEVVLQQLLSLVPMGRHIRRSRIYLGGHWMRDPLDVIELATHLPVGQRLKMLWTYLRRPKNLEDVNFQDFVLRRYGHSLYRLFFQPYTEKLFGIPGDEISVYWARQKVRLANPLDNYRENTKTKFQYFYYPVRGGYGAIANRMVDTVRDHILLDTTVKRLETAGNRIEALHYTHLGENVRLPVDMVISTLPLSITGRLLGHDFSMNYQKVEAVYLLLNRPLVSDYHWIYFVDQDVCINRMVEFKNMSSAGTPAEHSVICAEVTQQHSDPARRVVEDLSRTGLISASEVLDTLVVREEFAYPVYDGYFDRTMELAQQTLEQYANLQLVGRAAEFRHREVDDNFAAAVDTVKKILPTIQPQAVIEEPAIAMPEKPEHALVYAVVLTYNHYEDTVDCLKSALALEHPNLRIVVSDNGSQDGTPEKLRQDFPQVTVIENGQNLGVPAGYNVGFQHALDQNAEYILMLNNDTVLPPEMLTQLLAVAEADPQAGIVMPKVLYHGSDERIWSSGGRYRAFPPAILMTENRPELQNQTRMIEYAPSCALLIDRRAFEQAGLFDPGYFFLYDDWDFSERVRAHGLHIWYAPNAYMWHKVSTTTGGPRSPLFWRTMGTSLARFYRRHGHPVWFSLPVHIGYVALREFVWKRNWAHWSDFWQGVREGLQKPLGSLPEVTTEAQVVHGRSG